MAILTGTTAQTNWWFNLPTCPLKCALAASAGSGCDLSDLKCICKSDKFAQSFATCLLQNCATAGGPAALDKFKKACANDTTTSTFSPSTIFPTSTVLPTTTDNTTWYTNRTTWPLSMSATATAGNSTTAT
ncbi:hypothetical protein D9619_008363 [Psilocybe cf. subviscida]|uniref:CFEM domain-containing protein n=1 Tax=Psilocybe cf. subviscida TaxID=2480587 RepID=A0A8H5BCD4_9AGAR|nr:hypothetical protein D9619_008363 [Psilocybe cf. subviscida]